MTGDTITTGLIIGVAAFVIFWLIGILLKPSKPRSKERALLLVFAVVLMAAMKWFSP